MFGWRKRSEGFEWREYVRTTVLVRRADRQRRIDDVRVAAVDAVKAKRDRGVEAGKAGIAAASDAAAAAAKQSSSVFSSAMSRTYEVCKAGVVAGLGRIFSVLKRARLPAGAQKISSGFGSVRNAASWISDLSHILPVSKKHIGYSAAALGLIFGIGPMLQGETPSAPNIIRVANLLPVWSAAKTALNGRAVAISGDTLRVDGQIVHLKGVEAPEKAHPCFKASGRKWSCGSAAETALGKLVRGKSVSCEPHGTDQAGRLLGECRVGETDIAAELVVSGKVFAESGIFAAYSNQEQTAREARIGIWQGDTARPEEWRDRVWQEAKRSAPDGCPIKGIVRASSRFYAMPWSNGYDGTRVREARGERWFCNEDDARAAGFKLASRD